MKADYFLNKLKGKGVLGILKSLNYQIMKACSPIIMSILPYIYCKKNRIVFESFLGKGYQNEPRLVCENLMAYCAKNNIKIEIVWIIKKEYIQKFDIPTQIVVKKQGTWEEIISLATSKIWVDNYRKLDHIRKTKKQYYLQMWHSNGPILKHVEKDALNGLPKKYKKRAINDSKMADRFYAECEWRKNNFINSFWYNGVIEECSSPYIELEKNIEKYNANIRKKYNLTNKKILLYAPTFRNDEYFNYIDFDFLAILEKLKSRFGGEWAFCVRFHPGLKTHYLDIPEYVIDMTDYPSFDEVLSISTVFITDYSGTLFKALRNKTITFIYASDYKDYFENDRKLYFDLDKLPASFATSSESLLQNIDNFVYDDYIIKLNKFSEEIGYYPNDKKSVINAVTDNIVTCITKGTIE